MNGRVHHRTTVSGRDCIISLEDLTCLSTLIISFDRPSIKVPNGHDRLMTLIAFGRFDFIKAFLKVLSSVIWTRGPRVKIPRYG